MDYGWQMNFAGILWGRSGSLGFQAFRVGCRAAEVPRRGEMKERDMRRDAE